MTHEIHIALVMGSIRDNRLCDSVTQWVAKELTERPGLEAKIIDPAQYRLGNFHFPQAELSSEELKAQLAWADGFLVVTPEYNHSYPAALKHLIDSVKAEWIAKPVGFVSYGGVSGGLRAVEHLRQVFAELHAMSVRDTLSFASAWDQFDENGQLRQPERAKRTLNRVLEQLSWWGQNLRLARESNPYPLAG